MNTTLKDLVETSLFLSPLLLPLIAMDSGTVNMVGMIMAASLPSSEEAAKKIRKPYTITKSRESWTEQEHDKFLEALHLFDRDWKKIEAFVGSKSVIQIRSHAQKYFLKVQKNGTGEHVPPPRPKRKSSQPYPQKAPKAASMGQVSTGATAAQRDSLFAAARTQPGTAFVPTASCTSVSSWVHHTSPSTAANLMLKDLGPGNLISDSSGGSLSGGLSQHDVASGHENQEETRAAPDFAEVYSFIGSVFDPHVDDQLKKLKEMTPIDRETVLLLMRNLSLNLTSPDFDEHKLFLSMHERSSVDTKPTLESNTTDQIGVARVMPQLCSV